MGILSSINKGVASVVSKTANAVSGAIVKVAPKSFPNATKSTTQSVMSNPVTGTLTKAASVGIAAATVGGVAGAVKTAGGVTAVASKVATPIAKAFLESPVKTTATAVITGGVVAGGGLSLIPKVFSTTKKATEVAVPILSGNEKITSENVGDVAKVVGAGLGITAVAVGTGLVAKEYLEKKENAVLSQTGAIVSTVGAGLPETVSKTTLTKEGLPITATPPITPQTVSMDEVKPVVPSNSSAGAPTNKNYQKVNILINQRIANKSRTTKYINKRKLK